jgi:hypothetical protein
MVGRRRRRYLAYGIPLLALAIVTGVLVVYLFPAPPANAAMNFTFQLLVETTNKNGTLSQARAPAEAIGESGGFWYTNQYNVYGVDSTHYPLYMDPPSQTVCPGYCIVHVKSRVVHNYTLGDYFNVWGQPLGESDTIGITAYQGFVWEMCLGLGSGAVMSSEWGAYVLQPNVDITLMYHNSTGLGCSPS